MKLKLFENLYKSSTIHGLKYLSKKYHWIERIFWLISLLISLTLTTILIAKLIRKIKSVPVVTFQTNNAIQISEITLPSITFCPGLRLKLGMDYADVVFNTFSRRHRNEHIPYFAEEFAVEMVDENRLNHSKDYLSDIDSGMIKIEDLGMKILKRLQIADLITRRGIFAKKNFSIPTDDILDVFNQFEHGFRHVGQITRLFYNNLENPFATEILTEYGLCMNFNNAFSSEVFDFNLTSDDFHYQIYNPLPHRENINESIPRHMTSIRDEFHIYTRISGEYFKEVLNLDFKGFLTLLNDPHEIPSRASTLTTANSNEILNVWLEPQIISIDESLYDDKPIELSFLKKIN